MWEYDSLLSISKIILPSLFWIIPIIVDLESSCVFPIPIVLHFVCIIKIKSWMN